MHLSGGSLAYRASASYGSFTSGVAARAPRQRSSSEANTHVASWRFQTGLCLAATAVSSRSCGPNCRGRAPRFQRRHRGLRARAAKASRPGATSGAAAPSPAAEALEALAAALQLAEKTGEDGEAAVLRERLWEAEGASPVAALAWRRAVGVRTALDTAIMGTMDHQEQRVEAVRSLKQLASPPLPAPGAEEALHRILREVSGQGAEELREAAEEALWGCWNTSGDEEVDAKLRRGTDLMDEQNFEEAVGALTEVVDMAPDYAEGWNKRATAHYVLRDIDRAIEDCARVLDLKPHHFGCLAGLGMCHFLRDDKTEAAKWLKASLKVHPSMQGPRKTLDRIERADNVRKQMEPRIFRVLAAFDNNAPVPVEIGDGIALDWDVHKVTKGSSGGEDDGIRIYFFRVAVRNKAVGTRAVRSLARFYALRFAAGRVFPLSRPTEGGSEFVLEPGGEHRYSWAFAVSGDIEAVAGGMLLERLDRVGESDQERFVFASLESVLPVKAPEVQMRQLERLSAGYNYMGQLDLTEVADA